MPEITIPYIPRSVFRSYHKRTQRWSCIVAHRACGKTVACVNDLIRRALIGPADGHYVYVAPYLAQAKRVAWEYLKKYSRPVTQNTNESELWVMLINGASIRIHGADNPDSLRGAHLDGIVLDEYADMRPSVWGEIIRPMLSTRQGWATFIGTPKGRNAFYQLFTDAERQPEQWYSVRLLASQTGITSQAELDDMRRTMTAEQYEQEAECSFEAAILGAYFGKELAQAEREGRITNVPYDPLLPVHTAWDLGIGDSTAIWFWQVVGKEIRVIDWYENHGQSLGHYAGFIETKGYRAGEDFVPHDAKVRELGTGRTRVETLAGLRRKPRLVPDHRVMDGINAARVTLPRCWFDAARCADGIEALRQYRADFDEKTKAFRDTPKHDWTSHSADAFRYLCMAWRELVPEPKPKDRIAELLRPRTLDELVKETFEGADG